MNTRAIWNRFVRRAWGLRPEIRAEWIAHGRLIKFANAGVQTRQVLRARARQDAMALVKEIAGGEPRKNRRRMALSMARREWRLEAA